MSAVVGVPEAPSFASPVEQERIGLRSVFSFPVVLGALLVLMTMFTIRSRFSDPDTWWHLRAGEVIWNTHAVPKTDLFSFTAYGHPWVAQEWLSELLFYGVWKVGGYTGLMVWFSVAASLLVVAGYVLCTLYSRNCKVAFLGGVIVWLFSTVGLSIRPHLIAYLLFLLELLMLQLGRTRNPLWFLGIPPLLALWINIHSSYFLGLLVLGVVLFVSFSQFGMGLLGCERWAAESRRILAMSFALSLLAPFINPIGWRLVWYPLDNMMHQGVNFGIIDEWQQTNFRDPRGIALLSIGALILLVPLLRRMRLEADELLLVALGFWLAVQHERMVFIFGILAAPVLCRLLATTWERYDPRRDSPLASGVMLAIVTFVIALSFPGPQNIRQQIATQNPGKAIEFLRRSNLRGNMLNEFVFGGYLIWAAPERKVAVDGRGDLYEAAGVLQQYVRWTLLQSDPNDFLDRFHIEFCLMSPNAPITRVLSILPGWKKVYSDELTVIFARQHT